MKRHFLQCSSTAGEIASLIDSSEDWSWAKNSANQGLLVKSLQELKGGLSDFDRKFVTEDWQHLKKKFSPDHLKDQLEKFMSMKTKIDNLQAVSDQLVRRHRA